MNKISKDRKHTSKGASNHLKKGALIATLAIGSFALGSSTLSSILYPAASSSAVTAGSTTTIGATVKEFIRLAIDTNSLTLTDPSGSSIISPSASGTIVDGDVNVAVTTNTASGFSLTLATLDDTTDMKNTDPNTNTAISSISSVSGYDASAGESDLAGNTWGFRKNTGTSESPVYTNWYGVGIKDSNNVIIDSQGQGTGAYCDSLSYPLNTSGCNPSSYQTYNINFGAKLTTSLPAGTYTNNVLFSATSKSEGTRYTMNFNSNGGDNSEEVINPRTIIAGLNTILPTSGFTKAGMGIKGWAFTAGATTPVYLAGQTVATDSLLASAIEAGQDVTSGNSFTIYAVWETAYNINFNATSGTGTGTGTMNPATVVSSATYTFPEATFTKDNYHFAGWALSSSATTATYAAGDTITIQNLITAAEAAGQTIPTSGTINLYAIWEENTVYMQAFDCDSRLPNIGDIMEVRDSRDNHDYHVKKLADGNCWMIDNLTISATGMVADSLDNTNTNIPSDDTNKYYLPPQNQRANTTSMTSSSVASGGGSIDFSTSYPNYAQIGYRAQGTTDNNTGNAVPENTAYYNFYTASLGYSYYNDSKTSGSTSRDICPKGWRLPFVSDNGTSITAASSEFANLARSYNGSASWTNSNTAYNYYTSDSTVRKNMVAGDSGSLDRFASNGAAGFTYAGGYNGTTLYYVGTNGYYWSSSVYSTYNSYSLYFNTTNVYPQYYNNKYYGFAVRCIAGARS